MNDPSYYSLKLLKVCGLHPNSNNKLLNVYFVVNYSCFLAILTLAIIGISKTYDSNVFEAIENLQTVFLYIHVSNRFFFTLDCFFQLLGKYPTLFFKKKTLKELLERQKQFWPIDNVEPKLAKKFDQILTNTTKFIRYFIIVTFLVIMNFFLQPILTGDLPVRVYVPSGWFHYINSVYWYLIPVIIGSIYGSDLIFCSLCVPVIIQFQLLAHKFEKFKPQQLKKLVDYHNFLIKYCNDLNKYIEPIFLNQVIVATAIICMQLFIVSQKEFLLPNKLKCLGYCFGEVIETAIYCFNAEMISDAAEKVGIAVYNSQWYKVPRKSVVLVIAKTQKKVVFNGLGLVAINLKTFTQIFKTALSFYSYLNTMVAFEKN
ncbi:putative odorant receptor 85d isoform X1 [Tribolium castaneum]|uniref:putative odorant receptor 85d isoform X1 n=1 Tax=Tribolium castaneum TaxID=7070 RepID=UPI00077DCBA1|nr:PREDICTED: putative odorant receptor 85d isoform X1 [Tribolium castaneum]|eukprot:XP_015836251.1 PREDICTED: putative odorant receptor 85d isoform X1 [Tribolium castaneum]